MTWTTAVCIAASLLLIRLWFWLTQWRRLRSLMSHYNRFLDSETRTIALQTKIERQVPWLEGLLAKLDIGIGRVPIEEPLWTGHIRTSNVDPISNITVLRSDVASAVDTVLNRADGYLRDRIWETFSPQFWIRWILFLPAHLIGYLGGSPESIAAKSLNVLYWVGGVLTALLKTRVLEWLQSMLEAGT